MAEHATLAAALCAAEAEMPNAVLDKINPHFKNRYASLESLRAASLPSLTKHGLSMSHEMDMDEVRGFHLRAVLSHDKTEKQRFSYFPLPNTPDKPQVIKSAVTYGTRTTWAALVAIASEEDDDGEQASAGGKTKSAYQARKDGIFPVIEADLRSSRTLGELKANWLKWQDEIKAMPAIWRPLIEEVKDMVKLELADEVDEGPVSSERLRASIVLNEEEEQEQEWSKDK